MSDGQAGGIPPGQGAIAWDFGRARKLVAPYVGEAWDISSAEARKRLRARRRNLIHMTLQRVKDRLFEGRRRDVATVENFYDKAHAADEFAGYAPARRRVTYVDDGKVLSMCGVGNYRYKSALIEQVIEQLAPESVCEAGCGRVRHLAYFAPRFPKIRFAGFDISANAIEFGRRLQSGDAFDPRLPERPGPLDEADMERVRAVSLFKANAADLADVADDSFELVYTVSALEQMQTIAPAALRELHRVTRRYAVFCEPFADNNDILQRAYLWAGDYFRLPIRSLESFGFRVVDVVALPTKPTFTDTLVLAEKIR